MAVRQTLLALHCYLRDAFNYAADDLDILSDVVISFDLPIQLPDLRCGSITIAEDMIVENQEMFSLYVAEILPSFPPGNLVREFPVSPPDENATIILTSERTYTLHL